MKDGVKSSSGKRKGCLLAAVGGIGLLVAVALVADPSGKQAGNTASPAATEPELAVTAEQLFAAYQDNEAAAKQSYGDKRLRVTGAVAGVDLDYADKPVVLLRTSNQFMSARASLTPESQSRAATLRKGRNVTLSCASVTEVIGIPQLAECDLKP